MIWLFIVPAAVGSGWLLGHGDAAANLRVVMEAGTPTALLMLQGVTLGLCGRDRVRLRRAFSSPTLAWLGKRLCLGCLTVGITYAMAPVAWAPSVFTSCVIGSAIGGMVWLGNLPVKL